MTAAFLWGLVAAGSLLLGALIAFTRPPGHKALGLIMGFGSGVLLSAISFELVSPGLEVTDGAGATALGLFVGASVFTLGDILIGRFERRRSRSRGVEAPPGSGLSIVLGALLDGVPETAVLGLTLRQSGSIGFSMLIAVFVSNVPEAIAASTDLLGSGWRKSSVTWLWSGIALVSAVSAAVGYALFDPSSAPGTLAFVYAFAAGAILTMLATSMMPEAYERSGRPVGFVTVFGFVAALGVQRLEG